MINPFIVLGVSVAISLIALIILATRTFYPHHRLVSLVLLASGVTGFVVGTLGLRDLILQKERIFINIISEYSLYVLIITALISFAYVVKVFITREKSPLKDLSKSEIKALIVEDQATLLYLNQRLETLVEQSQNWPNLRLVDISNEKRKKIETLWQQFVEVSFELDIIKLRHRTFYQTDIIKNRPLHTSSFILAYTCLVAQYKNILAFTENIGANEDLVTIFNQPNTKAALPGNLYTQLKQRLTRTNNLVRLNAGRAYLKLLNPKSASQEKLRALVKKNLKYLDTKISNFPKIMVQNPIELLEHKAFQSWYPIQKKATLKLGYVRATRRDYLITPKTINQYRDLFWPGDILLQRREWHAVNLGIPGFWTHLALYIGTFDEIDETFQALQFPKKQTPSAYLASKFPKKIAQAKTLFQGRPCRIIEAKRPGVILNSLEESTRCDSLAVVRPNASLEERFKAIEIAFSNVGKGYDYSFDFRTDQALVCSEVIYKSYQEAKNFNLSTHLVNGRPILTPNSIAQKFDMEFDTVNPELEFVLFLEGHERTKRVKKSHAQNFQESWKRPKWHIVTDYLPGRK